MYIDPSFNINFVTFRLHASRALIVILSDFTSRACEHVRSAKKGKEYSGVSSRKADAIYCDPIAERFYSFKKRDLRRKKTKALEEVRISVSFVDGTELDSDLLLMEIEKSQDLLADVDQITSSVVGSAPELSTGNVDLEDTIVVDEPDILGGGSRILSEFVFQNSSDGVLLLEGLLEGLLLKRIVTEGANVGGETLDVLIVHSLTDATRVSTTSSSSIQSNPIELDVKINIGGSLDGLEMIGQVGRELGDVVASIDGKRVITRAGLDQIASGAVHGAPNFSLGNMDLKDASIVGNPDILGRSRRLLAKLIFEDESDGVLLLEGIDESFLLKVILNEGGNVVR